MKYISTLLIVGSLLAGCVSTPPPARTVVVVPNNSGTTTVVCQNGNAPPCY
jgi:hypothetical protein